MKIDRGPGLWETLRDLLAGPQRSLDCFQIEVSTRCPAQCRYCPHTRLAGQWRTADMELGIFCQLWPLMRRSSRVHLQGWGEPLLHADFFEMVAAARKAGCAVSTTTSGLPVSAAVAEQLVNCGLDMVAFSLAGTDSDSNSSRRGVDFDRVCGAIETLQHIRRVRQGVHLEIHIAYLLLASNLEAVRALPALMDRLGVHAVVVSTLDYLPDPDLESESFALHESDKLQRAARVLQETTVEAHHLGLGFHWALPSSAVTGNQCRENPSALFSYPWTVPWRLASMLISRLQARIHCAGLSAMCAARIHWSFGEAPLFSSFETDCGAMIRTSAACLASNGSSQTVIDAL